MDPAEWPVAAVWIGVVVVGLVVGSFLNVVILRLPAMLQARWQLDAAELLGDPLAQAPAERFDLISPRSRCPHCATPIKARHNLPVLGYLLLGGRCATCGGPISIQYPLVEIAAALLGVLALARFGLTPWGGCIAAVSWALLVLAVIDLEIRILPDIITLPLLWAGLLASLLHLAPRAPTPAAAILGAAGGYLVLWALFQGFRLATGKIGMGRGDFKLTAALGAWLGWAQLPLVLLVASLGGVIIGGLLLAAQRAARDAALPFGPWLAIGGWIALLSGDTILHAYLTLSGIS